MSLKRGKYIHYYNYLRVRLKLSSLSPVVLQDTSAAGIEGVQLFGVTSKNSGHYLG